MTALLDGRDLARSLRGDATSEAEELRATGTVPTLAVVVATDDESTAWYVRSITSAANKCGIDCRTVELGARASMDQIAASLDTLSADESIHGIILQTPLPDGTDLDRLRQHLVPSKDVDGANPITLGRLFSGLPAFAPATAEAVIRLLDHHQVPLFGKTVTVVGRSIVVGKPVSLLLLDRDATVCVAHRHTDDLVSATSSAEIVVVAVGVPGLITAGHVAPGAVLIDVGTTATDDGRLLGDVDLDSVTGTAGAVSPVPGGVGPVTTALLLVHTVAAARAMSNAGDVGHPAGVNEARAQAVGHVG